MYARIDMGPINDTLAHMDSLSSPLRALSRGIGVLRAISQSGPISLSEMVEATGLAHTTVVRIVRTLESDGLVRRIDGSKRYAVTELTLGLSCGFTQDDRLTQQAAEPIRELTRQVGWPIAILTRVGGAMIVRDSTVRETSLTFNVYDAGITLPMFASAAGRVFFAFSTADERAEMLARALQGGPSTSTHVLEEFRREDVIERIRRDGHVAMSSVGSEERVRGNAAIAVPILIDGSVRGALSLVFFSRAMPLARAIAQLVPPLSETARGLSIRLGRGDQARRPVGERIFSN